MATDKMYELAFQYRSTKLWKQVYDSELFAVRLSDGEIGYCSVMGELGEHLALSVYVGERGYQSYRMILDADPSSMDPIKEGFLLTSQDCLQCAFEKKDMLSDEELAEVRQYAKAHQRPLRGKNAFPQFTKYRPGRFPWHFDSPLDEARICDALSAAITLSGLLQAQSKEEMGLFPLSIFSQSVPLLEQSSGSWTVTAVGLPNAAMQYPEPPFDNELLAMRIKGLKKRGVWECGIVCMPKAVQSETPEEAPYFPQVLVAVNLITGMILKPVTTDAEDPAEMINGFAEELLNEKTAPKKIRAYDDRTYALLRNLCGKTGIRLVKDEKPEEIRNVMLDLIDHMGLEKDEIPELEQMDQLFQTLMIMRDGELRQMPPDLVRMILEMADMGVVPPELAKRLRRLFG